jgi:leader peptidase (prepilin peptidase)/N-methyltransferase
MIRILGTIFAGLLGLAFGSFLNVCLSRWPAGESIVRPRSHCRQCNRTLTWWENVPLVSWLALRGRCRTCRAWIGWRYPLVEAAVGGLWAYSAWPIIPDLFNSRLPVILLCWDFVVVVGMIVFYWLLVALATLDAENLWLPNWITFPGVILGLLLVIAKSALNTLSPFHDTVYGSELKMITVEAGLAARNCVIGILAAAALILLIRWLYWLIRRREGIGLGDAKLMAMLGAWLGFPQAMLAFGIGVVLGALVAVILLVVPSVRRDSETWALSKLPLGTFLCIGGIVSSLWGGPILDAYRHWPGF